MIGENGAGSGESSSSAANRRCRRSRLVISPFFQLVTSGLFVSATPTFMREAGPTAPDAVNEQTRAAAGGMTFFFCRARRSAAPEREDERTRETREDEETRRTGTGEGPEAEVPMSIVEKNEKRRGGGHGDVPPRVDDGADSRGPVAAGDGSKCRRGCGDSSSTRSCSSEGGRAAARRWS